MMVTHALVMMLLLELPGDRAAGGLELDVDFSSFLARSDMVWEWNQSAIAPPPNGWWSMGFTGNGMLGAMLTAGGNTSVPGDVGSLRIELGRSDVVDDRFPGSKYYTGEITKCDRNRLPIGYFQLKTAGEVLGGSMRLALWDAEATGTISTSKGTVEFTVLTHALKDFHAVNYRGTGGERAAGFEWHPRQGDSPWGETVCKGSYIGNPPLSSGVTPQSQVAFTQQPLRSGASYATAHASRVEADGTTTLFASTAQPQTDVNSIGTAGQSAAAYVAISNVEVGLSLGWAAARHSHQTWWHAFYPASFVTLTDSKLEAFYWAQIYKLASATGENQPGPSYGTYDHTGPWFTPSDTCCPLFNWDMNFPVQYQIIASSNHPELGKSMARLISDPMVRADLVRNAGWIQTNSTPSNPDLVLSGPDGITSFRFLENHDVKPPMYSTNLLWALVNFWNLYRVTQDGDLLPDFYAVLRGSVNHQAHLATKGTDGLWHMPETNSPEYPLGAAGGDTNYQLALTRWGIRTLFEVCDLLHCDEPRRAQFADLTANLAPFPASSDVAIGAGRGLHISKDTLVTTSHRHYSHMLPCWNTGLLDWDKAESRQLCLDTLDNWHAGCNKGACVTASPDHSTAVCDPAKDMTWEWDGFTYPASASYNSRAGRATAAWGNLTLMINTVWPKHQLNWGCPHKGAPWPGSSDQKCIGAAMQPNTFQGENGGDSHADPTSETPLAMAASVQDMLMFSDDDDNTVRVFQGVPPSVDEAAFYQLRAAGAFLVSARRTAGKTAFVHLASLAGRDVGLAVPVDWDTKTLTTDDPKVSLSCGAEAPGICAVKGLLAGAAVAIFPRGEQPASLTIKQAVGTAADFNWWGQHPGGAGRD